MARTVSIGRQGFEDIRRSGSFYVDKTGFIRDWWQAEDDVTLMCRPRRFGKTLMLDTVRCFLSLDFAGRGEELFGGLEVWGDPSMRALQGTVPLVHVSFADCKGPTLEDALALTRSELSAAVRTHGYLLRSDVVDPVDRAFLAGVSDDMGAVVAKTCLKRLCHALLAHHGVRPVVLLDEYDTPMQEAWLQGYWEGMSSFVRGLFNSTFKTNPALGRGLITGVTRVAQESIFSDMNNPKVVTVTTPAYETSFGFTRDEVADALDEFGLSHMMPDVEAWYDGFRFGDVAGIYNPWSITSFLDEHRIRNFWANTSSNALVGELMYVGGRSVREDFEVLLAGGTVSKRVDEKVNFRRLRRAPGALWPLLLATGYLRVASLSDEPGSLQMELAVTNREVRACLDQLVLDWVDDGSGDYSDFVKALLAGNVRRMNVALGDIARFCVSSFDSGVRSSEFARPERFWHGLVLGLVVELRGRYDVRSNEESGYGRCDLMLAPLPAAGPDAPAIVVEFKVAGDGPVEEALSQAVADALDQIGREAYDTSLASRGIDPSRIRHYGIAFCGTRVLVGGRV